MNFEETFDELVIRKLADIEDVPTWNDTVIAKFKDWKSPEVADQNEEINFTDEVRNLIDDNIRLGGFRNMSHRNDTYREHFANWVAPK